MSTNIPNLIGNLISPLRESYIISSITNVGTLYTINTSDTNSLTVGDYISISGNNYVITSLTTNVKFTVVSTISIIGTTWTALTPYYFYGTPIMVSNEIDKLKNYKQKFPIVVLFETISADVDDDPKSNIERTASLELYFMDEANFVDWNHEDYYTNVINRMQVLVDLFIDTCKDSPLIGTFTKHKETNYSKWNMIRLDTGKNVFNSELSGIGVNIDLPIKKQLICC